MTQIADEQHDHPASSPTDASANEAPSDVDPHAPPRYSRRWMIAMFAWVAVWALAIGSILDHPFNRAYDWNASLYGSAARNIVNEGFAALNGGVYILPGEFPLEDRDFYAGHPPLMTWMLAGWMSMFGDSEVAIRSMPLVTSALNLVLLYFLVSRVLTPPAGLAASVICSLMPMTAFYAQSVNMEWFTTTAMLGASLAYLRWARCGCKAALAALFACVVLGCWMDWPMYIFSGLLGGMHWLGKGRVATLPLPEVEANEPADVAPPERRATKRPWAISGALVGVPVLMFIAFHIYASMNGSGVGELLHHAEVRSGIEESGAVAAAGIKDEPSAYEKLWNLVTLQSHDSLRDSVHELRDHFVDLFTFPALLLALVGAVAWRWWSRQLATGDLARRVMFRLLVVWIATQAIYTLAFPDGAMRHNYWNYYLVIPVSILAAGLCVALTIIGLRKAQTLSSGGRLGIGVLDRAAWAVAATIPLFALSGFGDMFRVNPHARDWERISYAEPLRQHTTLRDAIFTDRRIGYALAWYAERLVFYNRDFLALDTLTRPRPVDGKSWIEAYSEDDGRLLFLWEDARADVDSAAFYENLRQRFGPPYRAGVLTFFVLHGQPNADWQRVDGNDALPPTTAPATAPLTTQPG